MDEIDAALDFKNVSIVAFYIYVSTGIYCGGTFFPSQPENGKVVTKLQPDSVSL